MGSKTGIEIVPAALTDQQAVVLRNTIPAPEMRGRRGRWKVDPLLVHDSTFRDRIRKEWDRWGRQKRFYPDVVTWWELLARSEEVERNKNHRLMEHHLYECFDDILRGNAPEMDKLPALQRFKAKIVRLNSSRRAKILLDTHAQDKIEEEEEPSLFHVLN